MRFAGCVVLSVLLGCVDPNLVPCGSRLHMHAYCGDGFCDAGETVSDCPGDCTP